MASRFGLNDKIAVVTGAGRGIGQAIAIAMAEEGANVVVASKTAAELEETSERIRQLGRSALPVVTDIASKEAVDNMVARAMQQFGRIDILVNAASIGMRAVAEEMPIEDWDKLFGINLRGTWMCCQAAGKTMIPNNHGKIINITSTDSARPTPDLTHYNTSKAAVRMLTKSLALDWAKYNIQVNALGPGYVQTRMTQRTLSKDDLRQSILEHIPAERIAAPEDIAGAAVFLASEASNYVTGITLWVDGGYLQYGSL